MRHLILTLGDAFCSTKLGPLLRSTGRALDKFGVSFSKYEYVEEFVRSTRVLPSEKAVPALGTQIL
jgi:hypothetical protein